jgi:hypothetical protein
MGAQKGSKHAEYLTEDVALAILERAESVISDECYFLSDVAVKCDTYREQFNYIAKKFKDNHLIFNTIKKLTNKCESIVVKKTADGEINVALGIFILKSYHSLIETSKMQLEGGDEDKPIQNVVSLGNGIKPDETPT